MAQPLSHQNKAKVAAAESCSTENTFSVKPLTTEVIKASSTSNIPNTPPTTAAADKGVPLLKKPYIPPLAAAVERAAPPLKTRSILPSKNVVGKVSPALSNIAFTPLTVPANTVATALRDAEIVPTAAATDKRFPISSTTSALTGIFPLLNRTAAIEVEKGSPASSPDPVPSPELAVAHRFSLPTNTTPVPSPTSALAQIPPEKPTAANGVEKSSPVSDTVPVSFPVVVGKLFFSQSETAHRDPSSFSGAEGYLKKNMTTSPVPLNLTNRASSSINQTQIPLKSGAGAMVVAAQDLSTASPTVGLANAPPVQIKPLVPPPATFVAKIVSDGNTSRISPCTNAVPKTTSRLKAAPDIAPTAFKKQDASKRNTASVLSAPPTVVHDTPTSKPAAEFPQTASAAKVLPTKNTVSVPRSVPKTTSKSKGAPATPPSTPIRNTTTRNTTPALPSLTTGPSAPSKFEMAPAILPAASKAETYPVQKPTPASQSAKTALKQSKSSVLAPLVSTAKASPAPDTYSALRKAEKGLRSLPNSVQTPQPSPSSSRKSFRNETSQKTAERLSATIVESFKIFQTELDSTITEAVKKKDTKVAFLTVEIENSKKLQRNTKQLLKMKQKTVASMEFVISGLRALRYGPQKLSEKEQQTSALNYEIEGLQDSLESIREQIRFKEQELSILKVDVECLKKSYSSAMELEKTKDRSFARLKVEIEKLKTSQKAAENLLKVAEHQIVALRAQVDDLTGSLKTAEKMVDLKSKEILGLRAALAFKAETDELKNARAKRDLDLLDKNLKRIKALDLEIERLKKSLRKKENIFRDDQEISALKVQVERLTKSQQEKNVVESDMAGKMQAVSKTPKSGDLRKNDLMGPLIYFTDDDLGIPTYEMDFEGGRYMPSEQNEVENDSLEPAIQAFTATGTGIQIHITKKISWRAVILLLIALLCSFLRKFVLYWNS